MPTVRDMTGAEEDDALVASTRAFVEALEEAATVNLGSRKQIARTLGVSTNTLSNWFGRHAPPNLERIRGSTELSINKRLSELEQLCDVPTGTFVALYRRIADARTSRRLKRSVPEVEDRYGGLARVHTSFPTARFFQRVEMASTLCLLNTWFPNLHGLAGPLSTAIASGGCRIDVTMLNPYCTAAITRASTLGYRPGTEPLYSVAGGIRESFAGWARLARRFGFPEHLCVHVYPEIPAMAVYQADDFIVAGLFLHGRLDVDGPQLEITIPGSFLHNVVQDEMKRIRDGRIGPVPRSLGGVAQCSFVAKGRPDDPRSTRVGAGRRRGGARGDSRAAIRHRHATRGVRRHAHPAPVRVARIHPVLRPAHRRRADLELLDEHRFSNGVLQLRYRVL